MFVGWLAVATDLWISYSAYRNPGWTQALCDGTRVTLAIVVLGIYLFSGMVDCRSLGLCLQPIQPVGYWVRFSVIAIGALLLAALAALALVTSLGWELPIPRIPPDQAISRFLHMCIIAPIMEESIYRLVLCFPTTATIGPTGTIILSGAIFAGLHFIYGNPSLDNFVAGYILAWAYLKSGSILIPIALHALGNCVAFAFQVAAWYTI